MTLAHGIDPPPPPDVGVGTLIRTQRNRRKMTQATLASAVGVGVRTVRNWEHGIHSPPAGFLPLIGRALGVRFVDDGAGHYRVLDGVPDAPPDTPQVVVIVVAGPDEAVEVVRRIQAGLDPTPDGSDT